MAASAVAAEVLQVRTAILAGREDKCEDDEGHQDGDYGEDHREAAGRKELVDGGGHSRQGVPLILRRLRWLRRRYWRYW